jgi:oligosaccharide repeat unit polymerase
MYIVVSIFILVGSFLMFREAAGTLMLTRLNMISWIFYFELLIQYFLSSLFVIYQIDEHYLISKVDAEISRSFGYWSIMYTMLMFPLGMILANKVWKADVKKLFNQYTTGLIQPWISNKDTFLRLPLYVLSGVCILAVVYTFVVMKEIPLLKMISGSSALDLAIAREEAGRGFQGNFFIRNVFGITLTPILSYISLSYYRLTRNYFDLFWFLIMFVFSVLIVTYNISKAPLVLYFLGFLFFRVLEKGKVSKKILIGGVVALVGVLVFFYSFLSDTELEFLFGLRYGIPGRIFFSQSAAVYLTFDTFPHVHSFLGFSSFSDFLGNIGIETSERSSRILMERYFSSRVEEGTAGVLNTLFIAEAYANFGWTGLLLAPGYVGFLIQSFYIFFLKMPKSPFFLGLFTYFSYKGGISGGFNEYVYNSGLLILFVIMCGLIFQANYLKVLFNKRFTRTFDV